MNPTNDPALRSWLSVPPDSPFPIQNLPYAVFRLPTGAVHAGVAIGAHVLDLTVLEEHGLLPASAHGRRVFDTGRLNEFMALGPAAWAAVRGRISRLLRHDEPTLRDDAGLRERAVLPRDAVALLLPAAVGDYTDFYSSREHATNVGVLFRGPERALPANWLHLPIAYHGRASSLVVSGTPIRRPLGQSKPDGEEAPRFGPSQALDFELETAVFIGPGNELGRPIPVGEAAGHLFGMVLLNDWSARDLQAWEYVPLGPFLGKNFATSISPWVVPLEALEPFRTPGPVQQPPPLPYLHSVGDWAFAIHLEIALQPAGAERAERIGISNSKYLYWNLAQQVAHHTVNGCNLRPGDLLASGTISGPDPGSQGSLLEQTWRGTRPLSLAGGQRRFLEDGDRVVFTGWCQGPGYRVGFGTLEGTILPART